ncbi:MAG: hypothetical protein ACYTKD_24145 [Planctomycetota bacterium]|jgi:hypothetical protein
MAREEEVLVITDSLSLCRLDTERWATYRFRGDAKPSQKDLDSVLEALARSAEGEEKPICVAPEDLEQPNSRALGALLGLLTTKDGKDRRVALAAPSSAWTDMLDIMGVRSRFIVVDDPEELASGE